jgi:hypothetical protein
VYIGLILIMPDSKSSTSSTLPNIKLVVVTTIRILYKKMTILILFNILFFLFSIPIATIGSSLIALVKTSRTLFLDTEQKHNSLRSKTMLFVSNFRASILSGIPYSAIILLVLFSFFTYQSIFIQTDSVWSLIGVLLGFYILVTVPVWLFRAADLSISEERQSSGFLQNIKESGISLIAYPGFSFFHILIVALLFIITQFVIITLILLPSLLVVLELVTYEETVDTGVKKLANRTR